MAKTVEEAKRKELYQIIHDVLGQKYINLKFTKISIKEDYEDCDDSESSICGTIEECQDKSCEEVSLHCSGNGIVDAIFSGMLDHYSEDYPSIRNISFEDFEVRPNFSNKSRSGSDAEVQVIIRLSNSSNRIMTFRHVGKSFVASSVIALTKAMEFYINSEQAFKKLKFLISDAEKRNRSDIRQGYISKISAIVKVTSYENV